MSRVALRLRVTGRVQGVAFRAWTKGRAQALGLSGWVRNESDGAVTGLIAGEDEAVAEMVRVLHDGPALARVTSVETEPADADAVPEGFTITG